MSVDANVLIFERIREEQSRGATFRMAIRNGFDRAKRAIVDANLTTLLTGVILYYIGTDQVKGFAVTLIIGKEQQLSIGRPDSSYLAYVGSETDRSDENATGLLVVLTPAPVTAADVKTDEKVTPSSYRK